MKISLIYPGATWSVMDVARGYETALRALGHQVSVFDYHTQAAFYGQYLAWLSENKGMSFPEDAVTVLASERVAIEVLDTLPDVVLIVMGLALHRRAYELMNRLGIPRALILTECPYNDDRQWQLLAKGHIQIAFANDKASVIPLRGTGVRVEYLPHSFDPERHFPAPVGERYQRDVFFHGTLWPEREALFKTLDLRPYRSHVGGVAWDGENQRMVGDIIENEEMAQWYRGAKIVLNPHRTIKTYGECVGEGEAWSLGPRAFEAAACGAFQICDDSRSELAEVFGQSVPTFRGVDDLQSKIGYYLAQEQEDERRAMAKEAYQRVQQCTFERRARDILLPAIEEVLT